ncbi:hypothetical protein FHS83_001263 [Rhizomicrobium palustre]|uniref:Uncharacterized protein n=1 Tax=Rhizomicrobium palustre TaxID=189966 RepID=A0A846MXJ4_9PROT|nr:hypothetical protein [Rhizomicrobium palustre]NIK87945.1 hypothetical protein [Rhizomicrobium palustre]
MAFEKQSETAESSESFSPPPVHVRGTSNNQRLESELSAWEAEVRADAAASGGAVPPESSDLSPKRTPRLLPLSKAPITPPGDTETELNGLIAECRFLMREVAFTSACLTYDPNDRIRYLTAAQGLASTAALLADSVGRLRAGPVPKIETRRHEMVYVRTTSPLPLEAEDGNQ